MKSFNQLLIGLLASLLSIALVLGSLSISFAEAGIPLLQVQPVSPPATTEPVIIVVGPSRTPLPPVEPTLVETAASCPPPAGWVVTLIQLGDSLDSLAAASQLSPDELAQANCLISTNLLPGTYLYVPGPPSASQAPAASPTRKPKQPAASQSSTCGPPAGWVLYTVRPKDNLYRLSLAVDASIAELQHANCLGASTLINSGQQLFLPRLPLAQPTPVKTKAPTYLPPPVTQPPVTQPPVTQPPATEPPATQPPATQPPATEPPATQPPATEPPATEPPATQPPETQAPAASSILTLPG